MERHDPTRGSGSDVGKPLLLSAPAVHQLREEARAAYPRECCGFLLGRDGAGGRRVGRVRSVPNAQSIRPEGAYRIPPEAYLLAEREARAAGFEIVGVYHSHPDGEPTPSERDRRSALPGWSYLVLAVSRGEPSPPNSWRLSGDGLRFQPELVEVTGT